MFVYWQMFVQSFESYVQEIGRAGRDGEPAHCHLFLDPEVLNCYFAFIFGTTASKASNPVVLTAHNGKYAALNATNT